MTKTVIISAILVLVLWPFIGPFALIGLLPAGLYDLQKLTAKEKHEGQPTPPDKVDSVGNEAGYCLKCGFDSLWIINWKSGKEELACFNCDPRVPEGNRLTRTPKGLARIVKRNRTK